MFLSFNLSRIQKVLLLGVLPLVLAGCPSGQPMGFVPAQTVPTPVVSEPAVSAPQPVNPGAEIGISIRVDSVGGTELTYEWVLTEGKILEGEGTSAITYQAPMEPGTYSIRVKVTSADVTIERSTFINVHEAETRGPILTNTAQPTDTLTQEQLTETVISSSTIPLTPTLTSTPISSTNTPIPLQVACGDGNQIALSKGLTDIVRKPVDIGTTKVFAHCPPFSPIKYKDITVDDELVKVELVCLDSLKDITNVFSSLAIVDALLPHYESQPIDILPGCRIDFTVKDIIGGNIGIDIQAVAVNEPQIPTDIPTAIPIATSNPVPPTVAPTNTLIPPTATKMDKKGLVTVSDFVQVWHSASDIGELIGKLDEYVTTHPGTAQGNVQPGWIAHCPCIIWTDFHGKNLIPKGVVGLSYQDGWGVFYSPTDLEMPTPGQSLQLESAIDPGQFK